MISPLTITDGRIVILGDIHKGCTFFRQEEVCDRVASLRLTAADHLFLVGDLLHRPKFAETNGAFFTLLSSLSCAIYQTPGNHDRIHERFPRTLREWEAGIAYFRPYAAEMGITLVPEIMFEYFGTRGVVFHGDCFDSGVGRRSLALKWLGGIYEWVGRFDRDQKLTTFARSVANRAPVFRRMKDRVRRRGEGLGARLVVYGHRHPIHSGVEYEDKDLMVVNGGSWNTKTATITLLEGNNVQVMHFPK